MFGQNKALTKLVTTIVIFVLLFGSIFSFYSQKTKAAPGINRTINFQGKLVNGDGTNTTNGSKSIVFSVYSVSSAGSALWSETQSVTTTDGIFRATLGSVTPFSTLIDFNSDSLYLGVKVGSDAEMTPRIQLTAVPYALNAEKVGGLTVTNTTGTLTVPNGKTISFADAFTTAGAFALTLTTTAATNVTLPTTGTLSTLAGNETLTNKIIGSTGLTFTGATTDVTTGTNEALTFTPNGTGDTVFSIDADTNVQITASAAPGVDLFAITNAGQGVTTTAVDGIDLTFVQADDADATDTNAGLNIAITNSSGDADTLYGVNIAGITGGTSTEYALNIGTGWDRGISSGSAVYVTAGGANITGGLTLNTNGATFSGITTDITTGTNEAFTVTPNGTGDTILSVDADTNIQITASAAPGVDVLAITNSGFGTTTTAVDGIDLVFVQADDADATDTNAGLNIAITNSSGDADTLYGVNIANITGGTSTEYALNIGTGWDRGISSGSQIVVTAGGASITGGLTVNTTGATFSGVTTDITATSGEALTINATSANVALTTTTSGDITMTTASGTALVNILTGNLKVGNGTPSVTLDGEDAYVEGTLEIDGTSRFDNTVTVQSGGLTITSGALAVNSDSITSDGTLAILGATGASLSTTAGNISFQAAGSGTIANIQIGAGGAGSATPDFLGLDVKSTTGDPAGGFEGAMYYNTFDNKFRCYQGAAWTDCIGSGGTGPFTDGSGITYLTDTAEDFAVGGTTLASAFSVDVSANTVRIGTGSSANAGLQMYASDGDTGTLTYNTNDEFAFDGGGLTVSQTGTTVGSNGLLKIDWSPSSSASLSGSLATINAGPNATVGLLFDVTNNGSSIFSVSQTGVTVAGPTSFTSAGDLSVGYDMVFTNQTASYIKSNASISFEAGESFESNPLTLKTYNNGDIVLDTGAGGGVLINKTSAPTADIASIGNTGFGTTTTGVDGLAVNFVQADDADATDTNAGLNVAITNSSGDADTLYGVNISGITGGTSTEYALNIGSGWDRGISTGSALYVTGGGANITGGLTVNDVGVTVTAGGVIITAGALAVNSDSITSDGDLTIDATSKVIIPNADSLETNDVTAPAATALTLTGNAASTLTSSAGGLTVNATSANLAFTTTTSGDMTFTTAGASGLANVLTGNLKVGNGTPTVTLNGEDAYVEGTFEVDSTSRFDAAMTISSGGANITGGLTLTTNGATFSGVTTDITTGTNEAFTVAPNGSGDTIFSVDSDTNVQITASAAPGVDMLAITNAGQGVTTTGVNGASITFVQADDADATDTNAGLSIAITNSSGDADTLYGVNIAGITGGTSTEYALNIGTGWDRGISSGSQIVVTAGGASITGGVTVVDTGLTVTTGGATISSGALAVNSDSITSDGTLAITGATGASITTTAGNISFQAAGTGTIANVQVGAGGAGSATPDYFGLDVKSTTGDPAGGFEGAMYYNTFDNKFRCYQGAAWTDCIGSGGSGPWTDGSGITYLTDTAEDFAVGASSLAAAFSVDVSANAVRIGTGSTANAGLTMYASDGDTGTLTYNTNDEFAFSGGGLVVTQTGTTVGSNGLFNIDWSPGSAASLTGSLATINAGPNATVGLLFNVTNNGTSGFSVSQTGITSSLPHSFTAAGDVSVAYDMLFSNQTSSNIKSNGPLTIESGESFESNDLTLRAFNSGGVVVDSGELTIGTGSNSFTFNTTTGPLYAGTARPTKSMVLNAEYAGATFITDGSVTTNGSMTSDNVGSGSAWRNYYEWTSTQASLQDYTIAVAVTLPADFDSWDTTGFSMDYMTGTASTADNTVTVNISNATNTPGTPMCTVAATASTSWSTKTCTGSSLANWNSTDKTAVIRIKVAAKNTASAKARAGAITLSYKAKF
jgi:hypothetical protein